jgi:hypothetical protein
MHAFYNPIRMILFTILIIRRCALYWAPSSIDSRGRFVLVLTQHELGPVRIKFFNMFYLHYYFILLRQRPSSLLTLYVLSSIFFTINNFTFFILNYKISIRSMLIQITDEHIVKPPSDRPCSNGFYNHSREFATGHQDVLSVVCTSTSGAIPLFVDHLLIVPVLNLNS